MIYLNFTTLYAAEIGLLLLVKKLLLVSYVVGWLVNYLCLEAVWSNKACGLKMERRIRKRIILSFDRNRAFWHWEVCRPSTYCHCFFPIFNNNIPVGSVTLQPIIDNIASRQLSHCFIVAFIIYNMICYCFTVVDLIFTYDMHGLHDPGRLSIIFSIHTSIKVSHCWIYLFFIFFILFCSRAYMCVNQQFGFRTLACTILACSMPLTILYLYLLRKKRYTSSIDFFSSCWKFAHVVHENHCFFRQKLKHLQWKLLLQGSAL